ncbi:hypothetical protein GCM10023075_43610 [Streptosporangium album]
MASHRVEELIARLIDRLAPLGRGVDGRSVDHIRQMSFEDTEASPAGVPGGLLTSFQQSAVAALNDKPVTHVLVSSGSCGRVRRRQQL